jgi:hypothetical protein
VRLNLTDNTFKLSFFRTIAGTNERIAQICAEVGIPTDSETLCLPPMRFVSKRLSRYAAAFFVREEKRRRAAVPFSLQKFDAFPLHSCYTRKTGKEHGQWNFY